MTDLERLGAERLPFSFPYAEAKAWLTAQPSWNRCHVFQPEMSNYRGYSSQQVLQTPGLLDLFNDPPIIERVGQYLGELPTLYSLNAWWSLVADEPQGQYSQFWHRDTDDKRFLVLFLALTDVDGESGATEIQQDDGSAIRLCGPAGSLWLVNTLRLHRGGVPRTHDRLMVWARYGYGSNSNSANKEHAPLPVSTLPTDMAGTPKDRHINRLLVDFDA